MAVEAVSGNRFFTSRAYTDNGNEYRRSNYGKFIGSGVGIAGGALVGYKGTNFVKEVIQIVKEANVYETLTKSFDEFLKSRKLEPLTEAQYTEIPQTLLKACSKWSKIIVGALAVGTALVGLGIGACGDSIANVVKRKNADKAASAENSQKTGATDKVAE